MKPEELKTMEQQAKMQCTDSYLQHYNRLTEKKQKVRITSLLQEFFNSKYPLTRKTDDKLQLWIDLLVYPAMDCDKLS